MFPYEHLRIEVGQNPNHTFGMEKRVLTLELVVEQNTKMVERLDRSMAQLCQAMNDLRVQMIQGQAELRKEMADGQAQLRQEIAHSHQQLHVFFERKFMWLISAYCGGLFTLIGFMAKYFLDSYAK